MSDIITVISVIMKQKCPSDSIPLVVRNYLANLPINYMIKRISIIFYLFLFVQRISARNT